MAEGAAVSVSVRLYERAWHSMESAEKILVEIGTSEDGLSEEEAEKRLGL